MTYCGPAGGRAVYFTLYPLRYRVQPALKILNAALYPNLKPRIISSAARSHWARDYAATTACSDR